MTNDIPAKKIINKRWLFFVVLVVMVSVCSIPLFTPSIVSVKQNLIPVASIVPVFLTQGDNRTRYASTKLENLKQTDKWIVVSTSSPEPNDNIKHLNSLTDWNLIIIGKTPSTNWKLKNSNYFGPSDLEEFLPDTTNTLLNSWKNIGYLLAMTHGAKVIYDADDNMKLFDNLDSFQFQNTTISLKYAGKETIFDTFRHFGQFDLKHRGFPLLGSHALQDNNYKLSTVTTPSIQQGLTNGEPDVGLLLKNAYLMTRKANTNVTFDKATPSVVVPNGVFSPFNSKNTLFHYDALWALVLPVTLHPSTGDIVRSYWTQRLLWEIGGSVGFFRSNTYRAFTPISGEMEEGSVYFKYSVLLSFLQDWKCPAKLLFFQCVKLLSKDMLTQRLWQSRDHERVKSWLIELKKIGYVEPKRNAKVSETVLSSSVYVPVDAETANSPTSSKWKQVLAITTFCKDSSYQISQASLQTISFPNILLIVAFNTPHYDNIPYIHMVYSVKFDHIVYCGDDVNKFSVASKNFPENVTFIGDNMAGGVLVHNCIRAAMKMNYNVDGYLLIGDDTLLNFWNLHTYPRDKIWYHGFVTMYRDKSHPWNWWQRANCGRNQFNKAWAEIVNVPKTSPKLAPMVTKYIDILKQNSGSDKGVFHCPSDILYIPQKYKQETIFFLDLYTRHNVFMEVTIPTVLGGLAPLKEIVELKGQYLWYDGKRGKVPELFKKEDIFMHPVKFSQIKSGLKPFFCKTLFPLLLTGAKSQTSSASVPYIQGPVSQIGPL